MKGLIKICTNKVPQPQKVLKRLNQSEAKDYVYHIKAGNIIGVDPSVVDQCPVCSQILKEMMNGNAQLLRSSVDINEEVAPDTLVAIWLLCHSGPGHLRSVCEGEMGGKT